MNPPEDWAVFENTHEAIVSKDVWELAQRALKSKKRTDTLGEANPLTGLMRTPEFDAEAFDAQVEWIDVCEGNRLVAFRRLLARKDGNRPPL